VTRYKKHHSKPEPSSQQQGQSLTERSALSECAAVKDLLWAVARTEDKETCSIPAWSGFNAVVLEAEIPVTAIQYLPFIHAPPSDFSTIYTSLLKLAADGEDLGQEHMLVTADLAIYSKAQQILWNNLPALAGKIIMRIGGMHLIMAYIASFGKIYGDCGLHNILTSSNVYASATPL